MVNQTVRACDLKVGDRIYRATDMKTYEVLAVEQVVDDRPEVALRNRVRVVVAIKGELRYAPNMPVVVYRDKEKPA